MLREYPKIETVFNRDLTGSKKLIEGSFRSESVEFLKDCTWDFTEKIDGTNIRVYWDGHAITFHGRTDRAQLPSDVVNYLTDKFLKEDVEEIFEQKFGSCEVTLFGEGYGPKIQKVGSLYRSDVSFILFDVMVGSTWLKRSSVEDIATALGLDVVPIIISGKIDEAVSFVKGCPPSTIGSAPMEGLVGRPHVELFNRTGGRIIVKIKVQDFRSDS